MHSFEFIAFTEICLLLTKGIKKTGQVMMITKTCLNWSKCIYSQVCKTDKCNKVDEKIIGYNLSKGCLVEYSSSGMDKKIFHTLKATSSSH